MINKELNALRQTLVSKRDSYNMQAYYLEKGIYVDNKTVEEVIKANEASKIYKEVASEINNILYPTD